jgi:hypothetical protein
MKMKYINYKQQKPRLRHHQDLLYPKWGTYNPFLHPSSGDHYNRPIKVITLIKF